MNEFKIGEKVFSYSMQEWGTVVKIYVNTTYPIELMYSSGATQSYTIEGKKR